MPKAWQPGIKVGVKIYDGSLHLVKDEMVELPPYVDGQPGRLWTVIYRDGSVAVLSSEYGPPHAKWPGKIKGWPVPSVEYRRKLWGRDLEDKKGDVRAAQSLLKELKENPQKRLQESWKYGKERWNKNLEKFSGPDDPAYKEFLLNDYSQFLKEAQQRLDDWMKRKP